MDFQERISQQRVQHIVDSYRLDGDDDKFAACLSQLLDVYPQSLIELALTESIVKGWSEVPMQRGMPFLQGVHERLRLWQSDSECSSQAKTELSTLNSTCVSTTSLGVKAANSRSLTFDSITTLLTPGQFEQITGLDASLVFDDQGSVLVTNPMSAKKAIEPQ
ncbi:hypothetical protein [Leptothoe spongobia]|uniref:Uncharacterized protein n=1 Tax=Leptothoe spongobia TAU-MAC 1115 TaxID=1967444 RepID=A0A947GJG9_9CYAN|nr:hypothetical protein [Leptothoe spongobia]MBT9316554.1 hypothetical protein [Leptothoe spongobia TAU-MAC 1115]